MTTPGGLRHAEPSGRGQTQQLATALPADMPVRAGDVIAGRYRVENVIGVGGMGVVVSGVHLDLEQRIAIKLILPAAMHNEGLRERFLREARAAARLRSEHVTKVLDVGQLPSGAPFMVMELLEGCDLAALLSKNGPLPAETAADFIAQACEAVAEAHAHGIVHRDIKPQNLFLTTCVGGAALVKVLDFGVSKISVAGAENLTKSMMVMGSPLYMSPEQMRSARDVDQRTDIWALGCVLFELLTGHAPFDAESIPALCLKVADDAPPSIERERPDVPAGLVGVVMRCLQKNPDYRYRDAGELASALAPFVTPASSLTIARAGMVMSGLRRAPPMPSDAPVAIPSASEARVKSTSVTRIVAALFACAVIAAAVGWGRGDRDAARATASMGSVLATAASVLVASSEPSAAPPEIVVPAPSAIASAIPPISPPTPKPTAARPPPPKPIANDDDIPSMR